MSLRCNGYLAVGEKNSLTSDFLCVMYMRLFSGSYSGLLVVAVLLSDRAMPVAPRRESVWRRASWRVGVIIMEMGAFLHHAMVTFFFRRREFECLVHYHWTVNKWSAPAACRVMQLITFVAYNASHHLLLDDSSSLPPSTSKFMPNIVFNTCF